MEQSTKPQFPPETLLDITAVTGIASYDMSTDKNRYLYRKDDKVFLVINPHTIELRTDGELKKILTDKYESVMESRYFGRGGIEIVPAGQLSKEELYDLVRLSYNLTN